MCCHYRVQLQPFSILTFSHQVKQRIAEEARTVDVIERMKLIEVAEQEVARRERELDSKVRLLFDPTNFRKRDRTEEP